MEVNLTIILGVIFIALATQFIVEALKGLLPKFADNEYLAPYLAMLWAIGLCMLTNSDLFLAFGYPLTVPLVGAIATGIIASLGANRVYDLIVSFQDYKEKLAMEKAYNFSDKEDATKEEIDV